MAVFRVERNKGYTVMSNHHLRNKELSLKAKGLLSQMLSLPEDWDYTLKGLSLINREKIDAIREAIKELERAGYIVRSRERDEKGRLRGADYVIFEQPQPPTPDLPTLENPTLDNPTQEKPTLEKPMLENPLALSLDSLSVIIESITEADSYEYWHAATISPLSKNTSEKTVNIPPDELLVTISRLLDFAAYIFVLESSMSGVFRSFLKEHTASHFKHPTHLVKSTRGYKKPSIS